MPSRKVEKLTFASMRAASEDFKAAKTAEDVRQVFQRYYVSLGYRRLCRMFVHRWRPEEMWLREEDRVNGIGRRGNRIGESNPDG